MPHRAARAGVPHALDVPSQPPINQQTPLSSHSSPPSLLQSAPIQHLPPTPSLPPFSNLGTLTFPSAPLRAAPASDLDETLRHGLGAVPEAAEEGAGSALTGAGSLASLSVGVPRSARVTHEKALPEDLLRLLLTVPPPPPGSSAASSLFGGPDDRDGRLGAAYPNSSGVNRSRSVFDDDDGTVLVPVRMGTGLLTRGLAALGLGRLDRKSSAVTLTSSQNIKSPSTTSLNLTQSRQSRNGPGGGLGLMPSALMGRRGRLDSTARTDEIPRTWPEYSIRYAKGELDIQDPPFPPIDAPAVFPSLASPNSATLGSPFEDQNFVAPLAANEAVRQRVLSRLDLLGLGVAAAATMSGGPASHPMGTRSSRGMSSDGHSLASSHATLDSFGNPRRGSIASTAPSSVHASPRSNKTASPMLGQYPSFPSHDSLRNDPAMLRIIDKARRTFGTRVVCISLLLEDAQVFLASEGMPHGVESLPRHASIDAHTVLNADRGLVLADLECDWRFRNNLLAVVLGARFYAGTPIYAPLGTDLGAGLAGTPLAIGAVSLIDDRPNYDFGDRHLSTLRSLAREVGAEVEGWVARRACRPSPQLSLPVSPRQQPLHRREVTFEEPGLSSPVSLAPAARNTNRRFSIEGLPTPPLERRTTDASAGLAGLDRGRTHALTSGVVRTMDYTGAGRPGSPALSQAGSLRPSSRSDAQPPPRRARSISPNARSTVHTHSRPPVSSRSVRSAGSTKSMRRRAKQAAAEAEMPTLPSRGAGSLGRSGGGELEPSLSPVRERAAALTPQEKIFYSAVKAIGTALTLDLVYLVSLDLTGPAIDPPVLKPLAVFTSADGGDTPSFEAALHLQALRSPMGGLLYRNPSAVPGRSWQGSGYATGVLLPVKETATMGWVLAGYAGDAAKDFEEVEVEYFRSVAEQLAKLVESV